MGNDVPGAAHEAGPQRRADRP